MNPQGIKAGDIVMVVKPMRCCGFPMLMGSVYQVVDLGLSEAGRCKFCKTFGQGELIATSDF